MWMLLSCSKKIEKNSIANCDTLLVKVSAMFDLNDCNPATSINKSRISRLVATALKTFD